MKQAVGPNRKQLLRSSRSFVLLLLFCPSVDREPVVLTEVLVENTAWDRAGAAHGLLLDLE